jgi:hypothetical protein
MVNGIPEFVISILINSTSKKKGLAALTPSPFFIFSIYPHFAPIF